MTLIKLTLLAAPQKNKGLRTVVNKLDTIDNVYRNFQMEVLAGDPDFNVELVIIIRLAS